MDAAVSSGTPISLLRADVNRRQSTVLRAAFRMRGAVGRQALPPGAAASWILAAGPAALQRLPRVDYEQGSD
jgi:hypothetical protein